MPVFAGLRLSRTLLPSFLGGRKTLKGKPRRADTSGTPAD
jgi:hypothetical protein